MNENLTISQIAQMAGVSVAAVSYALNGKKGISEETRKKILDVVERTNYTPNINSRRLILQRSFNILLITDVTSTLNNLFYTEITTSIVENGTKLGYNTVLLSLNDCMESAALANMLSQHNVDGIIFLCDIGEEIQKPIKEAGIPFVVVDSQMKTPPYPSVHADYSNAAYCAVNYLISNGHKKIALIDIGTVSEYYACVFDGYKTALEENGAELNEKWIKSGFSDEEDIYSYMKELVEGEDLPTAIFCSSDLVAINVMNYLQRKGYTLPDDFSVCSIDDIILARYHYPALTTVGIDKISMGKHAIHMLDKLINGEVTQTDIILPSYELVIRDSVKKVN